MPAPNQRLQLTSRVGLDLRWPVQVADVAVPVWVSALAFIIVSTFAIWAFRTAKGAA